ncbi:MAG: hypothetical protein KatS3mg077_0187 [Candidatus Binatia bacterium]|nr:MAG: hypothetical protein KatS3mg077_0187 [Candidatus Binatia bacterium]
MRKLACLSFLFAISVLLVVRTAPAQPAKETFPQFCEEWMQKLAERERRNRSLIDWKEEQGEVRGTYIGYSSQHECTYKESKDATPLGKITYLEVRYEKRGATREEAERNPARAIETVEVTEIFRYAKGKWVY